MFYYETFFYLKILSKYLQINFCPFLLAIILSVFQFTVFDYDLVSSKLTYGYPYSLYVHAFYKILKQSMRKRALGLCVTIHKQLLMTSTYCPIRRTSLRPRFHIKLI
jgi:hypothetical protein